MFLRLKDTIRLTGVIIITFCAVFVCTMFLNYQIDLRGLDSTQLSGETLYLYHAQVLMSKVISALSGGCLLLTSAVILFFHIKNYIRTHSGELGILKALGYPNRKLAFRFSVFGFSVFVGTSLGFFFAFLIMPAFYNAMNENGLYPGLSVHFNSSLYLFLVILPTAVFCLISVEYAWYKLNGPVLGLIRETEAAVPKRLLRKKRTNKELTFLQELKRATRNSRRSLLFFIAFASFCFSSMMQMSVQVKKLASPMFSAIIGILGLVLSFTTLFLAVSAVVNSNSKHISILNAFGYSYRECCSAIINGYRLPAWIGFFIGTAYQYILMKLVIQIFTDTMETLPELNFNFPVFCVVFVLFGCIYEGIMHFASLRIRAMSVKTVMTAKN